MGGIVLATVAAAVCGSVVGLSYFLDWRDKVGAIMLGVLFALVAFVCVICGR